MLSSSIKALAFDVFGTVLDWKGTITSEGRRIGRTAAPNFDWDRFADAWMRSYGQAIHSMKKWTRLEKMLSAAFYPLATECGLDRLLNREETRELADVWCRLRPWPDAVTGFERLHGHYTLAAFTNANHGMLADLALRSELPWDRLLSAESVQRYKPDPAVYLMALDKLNLPPDQVMLVASHCFDLNAAQQIGIRTALITRKGEPGSDPTGLDHTPDIIAENLDLFARQLVSID